MSIEEQPSVAGRFLGTKVTEGRLRLIYEYDCDLCGKPFRSDAPDIVPPVVCDRKRCRECPERNRMPDGRIPERFW